MRSASARALAALLALLPATGASAQAGHAAEPDTADVRIRALLDGAHFDEAEELARSLAESRAELSGSESLEHARALDLLVEAMMGAGKSGTEEVERLVNEIIALKRRLPDATGAELAVSLRNLGRLHIDRGEPESARPPLERALALQEAEYGPEHPDLIRTLRNLGYAHTALGSLDDAEAVYLREAALVTAYRGPDHIDLVANLYNMGWLLVNLGDFAEAERRFELASDIVLRSLGPASPRMVWPLLGLGSARDFQGDHARAVETHERALEIARATLGADHPMVGSCESALGADLMNLGDFDEARRVLEGALEVTVEAYGPEHENTGRTLRALAEVAYEQGDLGAAEQYLERATRVFERAGADYLRLDVRVLEARHLAERGAADEAVGLLRSALASGEEAIPEHPDLVNWGVTLGETLLGAGRHEDAATAFLAATGRAERQGYQDLRGYLAGLAGLATARARNGETAAAMEQAKRVEEISIARTRLLVASLPERQALRAAEERASSIDLLLSLADKGVAGAVELAWDAVVRARAAVLDELAFRQRLSVGEGVDQELAEYATASRRLANLLVHGPPTGDAAVFKESVASARRRREAAEKRLALASAEYRRLDGERDIGLDRVRAALPSGSALVGYVLYRPDPLVAAPTAPGLSIDEEARPEERYAALVAGPESAVRLVHLGAREEVDAAVDRWRRAIADGLSGGDEAAYRHQAADLRRLVWDPVAARLDSRGRVFVVPDGRLHLVSLATLPKGATGYLVEETTFHYLSSERDLAAPVGGPGGSGLLAVGGADYGDASDESAPAEAVASTLRAGEACPAFRRASFEPLEGAASEARSIASRWQAERGAMAGAALLLEGADASEARFKAEAPGRRVLHLATHGFFLGAECPTSASGERGVGGLVGPGDETQTAAAVGEWLGPLQLSGLALAGANRPARAEPDEEDGILTAEEISALELTGVEWAVLSGCDTGLGEIRAREGVFGLRRAFRVAGASTLIMSLWKVHDEVAAEWMESLYEARLTGGADTMTAVTAATRELLANRRRNQAVTHPALWGGFVASGEWR